MVLRTFIEAQMMIVRSKSKAMPEKDAEPKNSNKKVHSESHVLTEPKKTTSRNRQLVVEAQAAITVVEVNVKE